MGKRNNQHVVSVPHARFIAMLTDQAELVGIQLILTEESSTSKASVLDGDRSPSLVKRKLPALADGG